MSGFWESPLGQQITGLEQDAFVPDFTTIPEGTMALGIIKSCATVIKKANEFRDEERYIEVIYKLVDGEYKNREVSQKIKVFSENAETVHRNLNMLKLLMTLCNFKPSHNNEPTPQDLGQLIGKLIGLKIGEWSMKSSNGSMMEGNFIREIHPTTEFKSVSGVKVQKDPPESALNRHQNRMPPMIDDDIPFM